MPWICNRFLSDMLPPLKSYDFEVGASCSIALQGKAKTGDPRVSRGFIFYPDTDLFLCRQAHSL